MLKKSLSSLLLLVFSLGLLTSLVGCKASLEEFARMADAQLKQEQGDTSPTQVEVANAIRQALSQGVNVAINLLGRQDGFNANELVRIALPDELQKADKLLRKLGQQKYADQFVVTMNRAAEKAVPEAASIFADAISKMSIQDAVGIVTGPENAATDYFKRTAGSTLEARFRPVVQQATDSVGVTEAYKKLIDKASGGFLGQFIKPEVQDLDGYITGHASDALFLYVAEEEQKIRANPVARTGDLVKKVFDYYLGS